MTYIAYYRVSTERQGTSGLGLKAQKDGVEAHMKDVPSKEFIDVKSGSRRSLSKRSEVYKAMDYCKKHSVPMVVYKLDRLGRDVEFLGYCLNSGVRLIACDFPATHADAATNKMVLTIMMAVAQYESERCSTRTKDALAVLKKRGVELGYPREFLRDEYLSGGLSTSKKYWTRDKSSAYKVVLEFERMGMSRAEISSRLTSMGMGNYNSQKLNRLIKSGRTNGISN